MSNSTFVKNRIRNVDRWLSNARCDLVSLRDDIKQSQDIYYEYSHGLLEGRYIKVWEKLMDLQGEMKILEMDVSEAVEETRKRSRLKE